jgi:hypothetical protein
MKKIFVFIFFSFYAATLVAQAPLDVTETTVKVSALGGEQVLYYGFAEGDDIIFTMIETNGKDLKDVEVIEWPASMKFSERKVARVEKTIHVNRTGIYKFRLHNSSIAGRTCRVKIQRVPSGDATKNFNTTVYWKTLYDTSHYTEEEKYLVRTDTSAMTFFSRVIKMPPPSLGASAKQLLEFQLPANTKAWALYIGTGDEGKETYYEGRERFLLSASCKDSNFTGYGAMAALALGEKNAFTTSRAKQRISYWFIADQKNGELFQQGKPFSQYKDGRVAGEAWAMNNNLNSKTYIGIANEMETETEVIVKAVAVISTDQYKTRTVQKMRINKREEPFLKN